MKLTFPVIYFKVCLKKNLREKIVKKDYDDCNVIGYSHHNDKVGIYWTGSSMRIISNIQMSLLLAGYFQ